MGFEVVYKLNIFRWWSLWLDPQGGPSAWGPTSRKWPRPSKKMTKLVQEIISSSAKGDLLISVNFPMVKFLTRSNTRNHLQSTNFPMGSPSPLRPTSATRQRILSFYIRITVAVKVGSRQETIANSSVSQFVSKLAFRVTNLSNSGNQIQI